MQSATMLGAGGWGKGRREGTCGHTVAPMGNCMWTYPPLRRPRGVPLSTSPFRPLAPTIKRIQQDSLMYIYTVMLSRVTESRRHTTTSRATSLCAPALPQTLSHPPHRWSLKTAS